MSHLSLCFFAYSTQRGTESIKVSGDKANCPGRWITKDWACLNLPIRSSRWSTGLRVICLSLASLIGSSLCSAKPINCSGEKYVCVPGALNHSLILVATNRVQTTMFHACGNKNLLPSSTQAGGPSVLRLVVWERLQVPPEQRETRTNDCTSYQICDFWIQTVSLNVHIIMWTLGAFVDNSSVPRMIVSRGTMSLVSHTGVFASDMS